MPSSAPPATPQAEATLSALGQALRARRKALRISAVAAAEAAGISRPTLHRIERGEPSVTIGAVVQVAVVLGLDMRVQPQEDIARATPPEQRPGWLPARIRITDYPELRRLAWHVNGPQELTPGEALNIYERNARHLDPAQLSAAEKDLIEALRLALGTGEDRNTDV